MIVKNENDKIQQLIITDIDAELAKMNPEHAKWKEAYDKSFEFENNWGGFENGAPLYIPFEVNDYCNMNCKMCWRSVDQNPGGEHHDIDMELLDKFLKECREMKMPSFFLGAKSECLINPHIKEIIRKVKDEGCGLDNVLITNGYKLTEDISELLIDCQWEKLFVSLDAATQETYSKIRRRDLSVVENNLLKLLEMKKEKGSKCPFVRVSFVVMDENKHEIQMFIDKWKDKVDRIDFHTLEDPDESTYIEKNLPDTGQRCSDPFRKLQVDCHGVIYPCASLYKHYLIVGNLKDMSIKEAWNSERMRTLREEMLAGKLNDVCKNCMKSTENLVKVTGDD